MGMKTFKYKFTTATLVFIYLGLALSIAGIALNTFNIFNERVWLYANNSFDIIRYVLVYFVSVALAVILISLLISSYYSIDEKHFKTSFGIIKSSYDVKTIKLVNLDRASNKLSVYFEEDKYLVVVVKKEWHNEFIDTLLKFNPEIEFSIQSKENNIDNDNNNKKA